MSSQIKIPSKRPPTTDRSPLQSIPSTKRNPPVGSLLEIHPHHGVKEKGRPPRDICEEEATLPGCNRAEGALLPRVRRGGGTSISSKARKKRQKIGRKRTNLSADSIVLHRAKVFRADDDDDGGCPAGRNRHQTGGERRRGRCGPLSPRRRHGFATKKLG